MTFLMAFGIYSGKSLFSVILSLLSMGDRSTMHARLADWKRWITLLQSYRGRYPTSKSALRYQIEIP